MDDEGEPGRATRHDKLLEDASLWFARMRGPDADVFRSEFEAWLSRDPAHRGAFNRAGEVFALGKFLAETPNHQTIADRNRPEPVISWRRAAMAACVLVLVGLGAWYGRNLMAAHFGEAAPVARSEPGNALALTRISTMDGARKALVLSDGSKITLEAGGVLATNYGPARRELRLERGRARFEVAHEQRPFVVLAGNGSVTARGTIFDVIVNADQGVTVHLLRGAVDVERAPKARNGAPALPIVTRLEPGESLNFGQSHTGHVGGASIDTPPEVERPRPAGEAIEFEKTPLSRVIEEANQGAATAIRLADPAIGDLKVSGRFRIDDPEQVADRLAALFNLKAERVSAQEILLRAR